MGKARLYPCLKSQRTLLSSHAPPCPLVDTIIERILLSPGECFRLIRWHASNAKIQIISANGTSERARGEGHHWHHHPETEITLFRSGAATRFIGDHIVKFSAPDLVLIGGHVPHYWHSEGLTSGVSVQCDFDDMNPVWSLPYFAGLPALRRLADRGVRISGRTGELVQQAMRNLEHAQGIERLSCFFQVLADLLAAPKADLQLLSTRSYSLHGVAGNVVGIRKALHLAFARFREEVHLDDVLKVNGMTKATFCRQFKKHVGQSYTDFLNHLRLQAACHDLAETDKPIIEVAFESGFSQLAFFYRYFRRQMGCSPKAFRASEQSRPATKMAK
jgi:AraC-like DNA-binding protein/mannose-6-phosphate isomerase-like protein (cupin superfamily)